MAFVTVCVWIDRIEGFELLAHPILVGMANRYTTAQLGSNELS